MHFTIAHGLMTLGALAIVAGVVEEWHASEGIGVLGVVLGFGFIGVGFLLIHSDEPSLAREREALERATERRLAAEQVPADTPRTRADRDQ